MKKCRGKLLTTVRLIHFLVVITAMMISQWRLGKGVVTGQVKDKEGKPVVGATVAVKNSKATTANDDDRNFSITGRGISVWYSKDQNCE